MLSLRTISIALTTLALAACADNLGPPTTEAADPTDPGVTDADLPASSHKTTSPISNLGAPGEIAFGAIDAAGTKLSGTTNWTSTFNAALTRYEITITGESYFFTSYATMVTPLADVRYCRTNSVGGKLLIMCANSAGTDTTSRLAFVTFKQ